MVGAAGLEPTTSCTQNRRATRLRHTPTDQDQTMERTASKQGLDSPAVGSARYVRFMEHMIRPVAGTLPGGWEHVPGGGPTGFSYAEGRGRFRTLGGVGVGGRWRADLPALVRPLRPGRRSRPAGS